MPFPTLVVSLEVGLARNLPSVSSFTFLTAAARPDLTHIAGDKHRHLDNDSTVIEFHNRTLVDIKGNNHTCGFYVNGNMYCADYHGPANDTRTDPRGLDPPPPEFIPPPLAFIPPQMVVCEPTDRAFQWGFAFQILFLTVIAQIVWSACLYALWIDAWRRSRRLRQGWRLGRWRAVLDLADSLKRGFSMDTSFANEKQLEALVALQQPMDYSDAKALYDEDESNL